MFEIKKISLQLLSVKCHFKNKIIQRKKTANQLE